MADSNIDDTIEDDLRRRNPQGPIRSKLSKKAKKLAAEKARKTKKKFRKSLFKQVGLSSLGFLPVCIIIFMLIGIVSFITTMPGLVQENIMRKIMNGLDHFEYSLKGEDTTYLESLAKDEQRTRQKEILKYLEDMGLDPVGFGFAAFYTRYEDGSVEYSPNVDINGIEVVDGLGSAISYNQQMKEQIMNEDLIFKYIVSNERTYLVNSGNSLADTFPKIFGERTLTGMIKPVFADLHDSKLTIDREKKQMVISSINWSQWSKQEARYNLETWAGRYGMPLEFLLTLHIATMSSDLTEELISNKNLNTEMNVLIEKGDYSVDYDITYDGHLLPIQRGKQADFTTLYDGTKDVTITEDRVVRDGDKCALNLSDEEKQKLVDEKLVNIISLKGWIDHVRNFSLRPSYDSELVVQSVYDAKDAFLGDGMFRVMYRIQQTKYSSELWKNTVYLGKVDYANQDGNPDYHYTGNLDYGLESYFVTGYQGNSYRELACTDAQGKDLSIYISNYAEGPVNRIGENAQEESEYLAHNGITPGDGGFDYNYGMTTGIIHGLDYYLDGREGEVRQGYVKDAIKCLLSQFDAYFYNENLGNFTEANFVRYSKDSGFTNGLLRLDVVEPEAFDDAGDSSVQLLLTYQWHVWLDNHSNPTDQEIHEELEYLKSQINKYFEDLDHREQHIQEIIDYLFDIVGIKDKVTVADIDAIYQVLYNCSEEYELALPRIQNVIKHWYKDVIFEIDGTGVTVYRDKEDDIRLPYTFNEEQQNEAENQGISDKLSIEAVLTWESGSKPKEQISQPYVVKGDKVTLDGELVTNDIVKNQTYDDYHVGDGYRTSKRLFTQGQYYTFDGTAETSKSIFYARQLEKLGGDSGHNQAVVYVKNGRIILVKLDNWAGGSSVGTGDGWRVYLSSENKKETGEITYVYSVSANKDLKYVSVGDLNVSIEESNESVERINGMLGAMGVVTQRKPVSFDNQTANGGATTLSAFNILEGMHTEAAEYIYKDLKEFLIELGYYTKAEFEFIDTDVLAWFLPDYTPSNELDSNNWKQNKESDSLLYGAVIYQTEYDKDGKLVQEGISPGLNVVAPGNCRVLKVEGDTITIKFDGISQPDIGILDGYTMIISGIKVFGNTVNVQDTLGNTSTMSINDVVGKDLIVSAGETIAETTDKKIQVILKDAKGAYIDNIQDYMSPNYESVDLPDSAYFYYTPYEGGAGTVGGRNGNEVAVGICQWTVLPGMNNISPVCEFLYNQDPTLCKELRTFISWNSSNFINDYFSGHSQLVEAFSTVYNRDPQAFRQLQEKYALEEKINICNNLGLGWIMDKSPVTAGTLFSLVNWGPYMGWQYQINESMTDEQIIKALLRYACTKTSTAGSLNTRWESQGKLAIDILKGEFTDIEDWLENKGSYPEYANGANPGFLFR